MRVKYVVTQTGKNLYVIRSYRKGFYSYNDIKVVFSLWEAKREIKKLKKHYAYCEKHDLPKVVWEEEG